MYIRPFNSFHRKNAVKRTLLITQSIIESIDLHLRYTYLSAILNAFAPLGSAVAGITDGALTGAGCVCGDPLKS